MPRRLPRNAPATFRGPAGSADHRMPNITIYVRQDLADAVRRHDIPISPTCQAALERKVRVRERRVAEALGREARESREHPAGRAS